jgi:hypothetical protein
MPFIRVHIKPQDNLRQMQDKKKTRLGLLMREQKKLGQLKAWSEALYLINKEIEKEQRDLQIIKEDLASLT